MNRQGYETVNRLKIAVGLAIVGFLALSGTAATWVETAGSFTNAANWNTGIVPTNGVEALIDNGGTAQFDGGTASVAKLGLGSGEATSGAFEMSSGVLSNTYFFVGIGVSSTGSVTQNGGSIVQQTGSADPVVGIGHGTGATGTYTLSDGALTVRNGPFHVGSRGCGTFTQTGGAVTGLSWMVVARYLGSKGDYTLAGGVLAQTPSWAGVVVGEEGFGTLTVTNDGIADIAGSLSVSGGTGGGGTAGTGIVNLCAGGTINTPIVRKISVPMRRSISMAACCACAATGRQSPIICGGLLRPRFWQAVRSSTPATMRSPWPRASRAARHRTAV